MRDLDERVADASAERPVVLALFDLDGFKTYNDTFGHPAGDALLARLGASLIEALGDQRAAPTGWAATSSACSPAATTRRCSSAPRRR